VWLSEPALALPSETSRSARESASPSARRLLRRGVNVAIFHLQHRAIGKATRRAGYAAAHLRYILREQAATRVVGDLPGGELTRVGAARWFTERELKARANGRVADRIIVALPIELDHEARALMIRDFVRELDPAGRIPWVAAIHDADEDAENPHAHVMLVDADRDTGKRVLMMSERGSTERVREAWETVVNRTLARNGIEARVDRRSLAAQGVDRLPTVHIGPERRPNVRAEREEFAAQIAEANLAIEETAQAEEAAASAQTEVELVPVYRTHCYAAIGSFDSNSSGLV